MRVLFVAMLIGGCGPSGECEESADCPDLEDSPGICLEDLDRSERYCTTACVAPPTAYDDPCPLGRGCAFLDPETEGVCIERVGMCAEDEGCGNGLDDDCDGVTDGSPCLPITCFGDSMCGEIREFVCVRQGDTRSCGARLRERNIGAPCSSPDDCYNGHCSYGYCEEACGPPGAQCAPGRWCIPDEADLFVCLRDCVMGCPAGNDCFRYLIFCGDETDPGCYRDVCAR